MKELFQLLSKYKAQTNAEMNEEMERKSDAASVASSQGFKDILAGGEDD